METNYDMASLALAPYTKATEGGVWMWPSVGLLAGLLFVSIHLGNPALMALALALYMVGVFAVVFIYARRQGVQPSMGAMPGELRKNLFGFWILATALAVVSVGLGFLTNFLIAGVVVAVGMTALGIGYHLRARRIVGDLVAALPATP